MTAAQHALAEGEPKLAAQRLIYARDADPANPAVLRLLTVAFWQAGNLPAAGRAVRDWARVETDRPTPERFASRIYEDMGAFDLATEAAQRVTERAPEDSSSWARLGRLKLRLMDRRGAIAALERARHARPDGRGAARSGARLPPRGRRRRRGVGGRGGDGDRSGIATRLVAYAHALARTDRMQRMHRRLSSGRCRSETIPRSPTCSSGRSTLPRELSQRSAA